MNSLNILKTSQFRVQVSVLQTTGRRLAILLLTLGMLFAACPAYCNDYYVAPDGNDSNDGSIDHPFRTVGKAHDVAVKGDNIFLRGGQHDYTDTIYIEISQSGEEGNLITLQAYQDEVPILDFSGVAAGKRGIKLSGSYWHLKGFTIQKAKHNGMRLSGHHNIIEQLVTRRNENTGIHLDGVASYNLVVDCDSYLNYDPGGDEPGDDADGFAVKSETIGPGNILRRCRAWNNSDDGYDFWDCGTNGVLLEDCWAFRNGMNVWGDPDFGGDGYGFKLGEGVGVLILIRCVAYDNAHHGIHVNDNMGGVTVYNCSGVKNDGGDNFYFDMNTEIHKLRNNLSYMGSESMAPKTDDLYNSWNYEDDYGWTVTAADFVSLDPNFDPIVDPNEYDNADSNGIDGPRGPDGSLPELQFLHLSVGSWLIDAGIDVGEPFAGYAPDLGAFEHLDGDCEPDGDVDLYDFACLAANWRDVGCGDCNGADFDGDGDVDWYDLDKLVVNWLKYD